MKMRKSSAYYMAQLSVLTDELIANNEKLEIIRVLQAAEDVAKLTENEESKKE